MQELKPSDSDVFAAGLKASRYLNEGERASIAKGEKPPAHLVGYLMAMAQSTARYADRWLK